MVAPALTFRNVNVFVCSISAEDRELDERITAAIGIIAKSKHRKYASAPPRARRVMRGGRRYFH